MSITDYGVEQDGSFIVWVPAKKLRQAYAKYLGIVDTLPPEVMQDGCICYSAYLNTNHGTVPMPDGYVMLEVWQAERLEKFLGPDGKTLFLVWVYQQGNVKDESR